MGSAGRVTRLLDDLRHQPSDAVDQIIPLIYGELRRIAGSLMRYERPGHTLQPTALVHEAWMRLRKSPNPAHDRRHFINLAAHSMREILLDYARSHNASKRGPGAIHLEAIDDWIPQSMELEDIIAVDHLLESLQKLDPRQAQLVELRFFAGLSVEEVAAVMQLSEPTIKREWRSARAWLNRELTKVGSDATRTMAADQRRI